jgi:hypothetical protein
MLVPKLLLGNEIGPKLGRLNYCLIKMNHFIDKIAKQLNGSPVNYEKKSMARLTRHLMVRRTHPTSHLFRAGAWEPEKHIQIEKIFGGTGFPACANAG